MGRLLIAFFILVVFVYWVRSQADPEVEVAHIQKPIMESNTQTNSSFIPLENIPKSESLEAPVEMDVNDLSDIDKHDQQLNELRRAHLKKSIENYNYIIKN